MSRSTDSLLRTRVLRVFLLLALVGGASAGVVHTPWTESLTLESAGNGSALFSAPKDAHQLLSRAGGTRQLAIIHAAPGENLQTVINSASAGDEIVLADGTYTGSGTNQRGDNMLYIDKDVTIRALHAGGVVLNGEDARRVIYIASGTVGLDGLNITRGKASVVSATTPMSLHGPWEQLPCLLLSTDKLPSPFTLMGCSADVSASTRAFWQRVACGWRLISPGSERSHFDLSATFSPLPPWESLLTCTPRLARFGNGWRLDGVWWRQYVRARISNFPRHFPHCPDGVLAFLISSFLCRGVASVSMVAP